MARPKSEDSDKLSHVLPPVRCTAAEKDLIRQKATEADMSLSEYVRQMSLNGKVVVRGNATDFETVQQLRKIGVNLNQQTKKFNATGVTPAKLLTIRKKLETLLDLMMEKLI